MAVQAVDIASGAKTETPDHTHDTSVSVRSTQEKAQEATKKIIGAAEQYGTEAVHKGRGFLDSVFPPEKRAALLEKAQAFISVRPKLSAFLGLNLILTGIPLILFILFAISTFVVSLLVAVVIALLVAVTFTLFAVGAALLVVLPTILLTTFVACSLFIWGLAAFYVFELVKGRAENQISEAEGHAKKA